MARTVYYAATSADGFIATANGGVAWLDPFNSTELGYEQFFAKVGAVVLGRTTYEQALTFGPWPYSGRQALIVTSRPIPDLPERAQTVTVEDLPGALHGLRAQGTGDVWVVGGAKTARACIDAGLVEEVELYVIPRLLGEGVPVLTKGEAMVKLRLEETRAFANGVVRVRYLIEP